MKQNLILSLLLLFSLTSWAQDNDASTSKEELKIPIKPIVVEGELTNVPDGTRVMFAFRIKKSDIYSTAHYTLIDTIRNGKFHIEKKFIYLDEKDSKDNVDYMLVINGCGLYIYAYQGANVKVTGRPDMQSLHWRAESNHPLQKELDEYTDYKRKLLTGINEKTQEKEESGNDDEMLVKLQNEKDSIYIVSMLDFMKNKECNSVFVHELWVIAFKAHKLGSEELSDRIRNLIKEKVPTDYDDKLLTRSKQELVPSSEHLHVGDKMIDFTLYDRNDKEHKLSEYVGKKIVVLQFSTVSCGPCQAVKPTIEEFYAKHKNEVEVITISCDDTETWKKEKGVSWPDWNDHASGSTVGSKFEIPGWPFYVIIRPDGVIGSTFLGTDKVREYFKTFGF